MRQAIIDTIMSLARSLGLTTVAEGVDSQQQPDYIEAIGCDEVQGYYFGKPQPADEFLARWQSRAAPA